MPRPTALPRPLRLAIAGAALAGALALTVPAPAYASELVTNGRFEQVGADGLPTGWKIVEAWGSYKAHVVDGAGPDGSRALVLETGDLADNVTVGQDVPNADPTRPQAYRVTFDQKAEDITGYGGYLSTDYTGEIHARTTGTTGWHRVSRLIIAPKGATVQKLWPRLGFSTGRMLIDNVSVEPVEGDVVGANPLPTGGVNLSWDFGSLSEAPARYEIHRGSHPGFVPGRKTLLRAVPGVPFAEDGTARPDQRYSYKVVALAADGSVLATTAPETVTTPARFQDNQGTHVLSATATGGGTRVAWRLKAGTRGPVTLYAGHRRIGTYDADDLGVTLGRGRDKSATSFTLRDRHGRTLATAGLAGLQHPRIAATEDKLATIRAAIQQPGTPKGTWEALLSRVAKGLPAYNYAAGEAEAALARDAALLYLVGGDPAYAQIAYDAVIQAGQKMPLTHPLSTGNAGPALATAYDWAYRGWSEPQRAKARDALGKAAAMLETTWHPNMDYPDKASNWVAVTRGGELALRLALRGDGDHDMQERRIALLVDQMARHMVLAYSDTGWYQEGYDYFDYERSICAPGVFAALDAGIDALKAPWKRPQLANLLMHSVSAQPDRARLQWGVGYPTGSTAVAALSFSSVPEEQKAAFLWQYEKTVGNGGGVFGLLHYPYGVTAQDPDDGPAAVRAGLLDDHGGAYQFRSRYQDADDVLVGLTNRNHHHAGWNLPETFGTSLVGQDVTWARQPGKDTTKTELYSKPFVDGKVEPVVGKGRTLDSRTYAGQGGGFLSLDGSANYQLAKARRDIAVDLRPVAGADSVIAVHDSFADGAPHTYAWQLAPEAGTAITFGETESGARTFLFTKGGGYLKGWVLAPEGAELSVDKGAFRVTRSGTEADFRIVLAVGRGTPPSATTSGGTLTLGDTTYDLDDLKGHAPAWR
ncbi:hypothetical protein [Streptomyces sp. FIT100]|uniref:hypothetical protein n=1 Tax=Streptomyces sp. FIT100 TaxID=2837956 RepID=UPI0021C79AA5|nr:hypothetical protein [Streptomyces sp. FIT100]UUN30627.1 hypothetical protein KK483_33045 [Streptomyces sp. FIT100]